MVIKILGTGCAKCKQTHEIIEKTARELGISPTIEKVEDIAEIMKYDVLSTPAIVIDEVVKLKGKVPTAAEVKSLLQDSSDNCCSETNTGSCCQGDKNQSNCC